MYTSFAIENFRLFDRLTIEPLARVNLIVGKNNAGKTALLEALWLHSGPNNPELGVRLSAFRGIDGLNPKRLLHDIFYDFDAERAITLSANGTWGKSSRTLRITSEPADGTLVPFRPADAVTPPPGWQTAGTSEVSSSEIVFQYTNETGQQYTSAGRWAKIELTPPDMFPNLPTMATEGMTFEQARMPSLPTAVFIGARQRRGPADDVIRFGEVELAGYAEQIVNCLAQVDNRIKRLTTIAAPPSPMIYADVGLSRPIPMGFLGDGIGRLLSMTLAFHQARNGSLLIDEVENGLHHSVLVDVWKNLNWLSHEFNVQVFATTHSSECLEAARAAFKASESDDLLTHRISRQKGGIKSATYSLEGLDYGIEIGAEIR